MSISPAEENALREAIEEARRHVGATSPNPPVGAAALGPKGELLGVAAHHQAGTEHAEARLLRQCTDAGTLDRIRTLVVTLEPCDHQGRTPPCTAAILAVRGIRRVVYGTLDPNPRVKGGGVRRLESGGLELVCAQGQLAEECRDLIAPFSRWVRTRRPYLVVKTAHLPDGSMIPPPGNKTFTSPQSLRLARKLRRRADAILTGSGTILADRPEFTVRHVPDVPGKHRWLVIFDRRGRVPMEYLRSAEARGFRLLQVGRPGLAAGTPQSLDEALDLLGREGVMEALVEAGPELTRSVLEAGVWDLHVVITQSQPEDRVETRRNRSRADV